MNREQAIFVIKKVTAGEGVDRNRYPELMRGRIAEMLWNDGEFTLGVEYGYVIGLMDAFSITADDLC